MATTPEQIDVWRKSRSEHQCLEFKAAKVQFDYDKLCEYCVALANEGGGHLVLGVTNDPPRPVTGTPAVNDPVKMTEKLFHDLHFRVDIEEVQHPEGRVVVCNIPSRPRGTAYSLKGRYLMRAGSELSSMTEDCLRGIFNEGKPDWLEEHVDGGFDGAQIVELLDTQTFFELLEKEYPSRRDEVLKKLVSERLITPDGDRFSIPKMSALLLAKKLSSFPEVSRKAARVLVFEGSSKAKTKVDVVGTMGYAVGFTNLVAFVMSHLPQNAVVQRALREEVKLLPSIIIRELVANALIHQDFNASGTSVMIEIFDNRVEISNPGEPVVEVNRFIDGYRSRNERLAALMRRFRVCEEIGSGIDKVVIAAENYQLPAPLFRAAHQRTEMIIHGVQPFDKMDRDDRIRACYQHCVLKYLMHERMVNQTLRERFRLPGTESNLVSMIISATAEAGLIHADSTTSRKYAKYVPYWA
jgi:predicted HTH transcriptional regulator